MPEAEGHQSGSIMSMGQRVLLWSEKGGEGARGFSELVTAALARTRGVRSARQDCQCCSLTGVHHRGGQGCAQHFPRVVSSHPRGTLRSAGLSFHLSIRS